MNTNKPTRFECMDDNREFHNFTFIGWAEFMKSIGKEENNSWETIKNRYRRRKRRGYSLRMCAGFDPLPSYSRAKKPSPEKHKSMLEIFLTKRLVSGEFQQMTAGGWSL